MVRKYKTVTTTAGYWRPGEDSLQQIVDSLQNKIQDGDIVTVSEKAISAALGNLVDENTIETTEKIRKHPRDLQHGSSK